MELEVQPEADSHTLGTVEGGCSRFAGSHDGSPGLIISLGMSHIGFAEGN